MRPRFLRLIVLLAFTAVVAAGVARILDSIAARRLPVGAPAAAQPFDDLGQPPLARLAAAGDVGTGGKPEWRTAAAMDEVEAMREYDALLLLGDNVYPSGEAARVDEVVLDPFSGVLDRRTRLVAALGNHDVLSEDLAALLDALGAPGRWYSERFGPVQVVVLDSNRATDPRQRAWLEETLAGGEVPWTIAVLHHPPYSAGSHGSDEASRAAFAPLFERYGVQLVLAGHDHDYQRTRPIGGVTYVVSGGAATLRPTGRADFTEAAASTLHFLDLAVYDRELVVRAVDQRGRIFDEVAITPAAS
jgi:3',5'-cyclic AMP phosphodiesterase CpdA